MSKNRYLNLSQMLTTFSETENGQKKFMQCKKIDSKKVYPRKEFAK